MRNNHFIKTQILLAALAAAVIAPICAFSQQRATTARPVIKDSDIYVPNKVLEPSLTEKEAKAMLTEYIEIFDASELPKTYEAYLRESDRNRRISARRSEVALTNLFNFIFDVSAQTEKDEKPPVNSELMEITGYSDAWFKELFNTANVLCDIAAEADKAIRMKNAALFTQACKKYAEQYEALEKCRKSPRKLSATRVKQISDVNREKRRRDYIAQRKKQMLEEFEAQRAAEEALNKAAGSSKKQ